jgi:hypothetical protein
VLQPPETATTVRVQDGETLVTDGPFAEMKESIGGYVVFEADDLRVGGAWRYVMIADGGFRVGFHGEFRAAQLASASSWAGSSRPSR